MKEASPQIINYFGNTAHGSSGGIILDEDLNIIGINFGFFNDEVDPEISQTGIKRAEPMDHSEDFVDQEEDIFMFDVEVPEEESNRNVYKNRNIAVSFSHPVIKKFLKRWAVDKEIAK